MIPSEAQGWPLIVHNSRMPSAILRSNPKTEAWKTGGKGKYKYLQGLFLETGSHYAALAGLEEFTVETTQG